MNNKICVYAIAKNEEQFVDKWYESMKEADYICVLDTGSEDNTVEKLKSHGVIVDTKVITPWRFDVARNESMKLIPEDANILVCTDLDEILEPGWADVLRERWVDGEHVRAWYKYAWSHDEDGNPARIFYYDKIHDRNWTWKYPVHEMLISDKYNDEYYNSHSLDLFDSIYLHHYPDYSKSRGSYLPLLELRRDENPDDYIGRFYLSHEYCYREQYDKSIDELHYLIQNCSDKFTKIELAACYMFLGDDYCALNDTQNALSNYLMAIDVEPTMREGYLYAAECYNDLQQYNSAINLVERALSNTYRHYNWLERDASWREEPYDILAVSYFYLNDIEKSLCNCLKASYLNPHDTRIEWNKKLIETTFYENV